MEISKEGYLHEAFRLFYLKDQAGQERDYHYHEFNKIVVHLSGNVRYSVDGVTYALQPWDVLLVKHHMVHKAHIDLSLPYERYILYISPGFMSRRLTETHLQDCFEGEGRLLPLGPGERDEIFRLLESLRGELTQRCQNWELMADAYVTQLLVRLGRINPALPPSAVTYDEKLTPILTYINEHLAESLTVEDIANQAYLSRYHFMRLFKERMGCTVHGYLRQKRLAKAAQMISEGIPAGKAAADCGFADYSVFLRAFRQMYHTSPGRWKP